MNSEYRPDIDGLRAIAVLSVLLFHAGFEELSGGFIGVDIFFVISGYLITNLILTQREAGVFSFGNFYYRRAKRLFPALFVTLLSTFAVACILHSPLQLQRTAGEILAAVASLSNIFFYYQSAGYFDPAAISKPALHTWSLSVEEQFYLLWPTMVVLCTRSGSRLMLFGFILLMALISLAFSELTVRSNPNAAYFLPQFRIFEFALGALALWASGHVDRTTNLTRELLLLSGLCLVVYALVVFDEQTSFPGFNALIPCLGAACMILGGRARLLGVLLSNRISVFVGLISYSLYLVHWPLIVFFSYAHFGELEYLDRFLLVGATFALATLSYYLVEAPLRTGHIGRWLPSRGEYAFVCSFFAIGLIIVSANAWANGGWVWRINGYVNEVLRASVSTRQEAIGSGICHMKKKGGEATYAKHCLNGDYLIIGPSTAADFHSVLRKAFPDTKFSQITAQGCFPNPLQKNSFCKDVFSFIGGNLKQICDHEAIVLAHGPGNTELVKPLLRFLENCHATVIYAGKWNTLKHRMDEIVFRHKTLINNREDLNEVVAGYYVKDAQKQHYLHYEHLLKPMEIPIIRLDKLFNQCDGGKQFIDSKNKMFMLDEYHLEEAAMDFYGRCLNQRFRNIGNLLSI